MGLEYELGMGSLRLYLVILMQEKNKKTNMIQNSVNSNLGNF